MEVRESLVPGWCTVGSTDPAVGNPYGSMIISGSEAGSCVRLIDLAYHSTLGLRVIKKKRRRIIPWAILTESHTSFWPRAFPFGARCQARESEDKSLGLCLRWTCPERDTPRVGVELSDLTQQGGV